MAATTVTSAIPNPPLKILWDVVEATTEPPKPEDGEAEFKAWRKKDAKALILIQKYCGSANYSLIWGTETAKAAWDTLAEKLNPAQEELFPLVPREDLNINPTSNDENESIHIDEFGLHQPFIVNVIRGDWDLVKEYLSRNPEAIRERGSISGATALHLAVSYENVNMAKALVELMTEEDLEIQDANGATAMVYASNKGITELAKCMIEKNKKLISLPCPPDNIIPLVRAYSIGHWELARYLYSVTPLEALLQDDGCGGAEIVSESFRAKKLGIHVRPDLAVYDIRINVEKGEDGPINERDLIVRSGMGILRGLVPNPRELFGINHIYKMKWTHERTSEILHSMCEVIKDKSSKQLQGSVVEAAFFEAIKQGHVEFVREIFRANPPAFGLTGENGKSMLQFAIECRQEKVYFFLYKFTGIAPRLLTRTDQFSNTLLHAAASLSPVAQLNQIQGAALQMQRELQWFKEIENIVPPKILEVVNITDGMTARDLFTKNHKELAKEGERSMKEIATSCTVVGALIITIMFTAAFTVPGGNNGNTGKPLFLNEKLFKVFIVSDALSLFSSTTSVMTFLGVLTSRYAEADFLKSLPTKMIIGLFTLFFSIATMMVAFVSTLFIMLGENSWIVIPVILLASAPVVSFAWMQFPLLVEIFISTYGAGIFAKKGKPLAATDVL
ncbi:ankyrin repeat-containing protein NPR4-like [Prunus dulcis]|uniref:ankyrin repeat-containing protein NPR4-like n=1 Tax=Prunus dulcis TaxID=3755 RepID=UPI001483AF8D|nr:ankyrin repeat-containing protein NPR4-like [Prunus dulcis]